MKIVRHLTRILVTAIAVSIYVDAETDRVDVDIPEVEVTFEETSVNNWLVAGPVLSRKDLNALDRSYIKEDCSDSSATEADLREFCARRSLGGTSFHSAKNTSYAAIDFHRELGLTPSTEETYDLFYSICKLKTSSAKTMYALIGNDDWLSFIVNGVEICRSREYHSVGGQPFIVPIELKAGTNLVVAKVCNIYGKCGFSLRLVPTIGAAFEQSMQKSTLIPRFIWEHGTQPSARLFTSIKDLEICVEVVDDRLAPVATSRIKNGETFGPSDGFRQGVYFATISSGSARRDEIFVYGDPAKIDSSYRERIAKMDLDDVTSINLSTLTRRMDILLNPKNRKDADNEWQRKVRFTLSELALALNAIERKEEPFKHKVGMHLRGWRSRIDGQEQHYRLFIPKSYSPGQRLPLVVILPTTVSAASPFIESPFVANQVAAENLCGFADQVGAAVLWPGYRCVPRGNPCDMVHLDEALRQVRADYSIDPERISLLASCSGGIIAEMCYTYFPDRFSCIAVLDGLFHRTRHRFGGENVFFPHPSYVSWLKDADPFRSIVAAIGFPVYIINSGSKELGHGGLELSIELCRAARLAGHEIVLEQPESGYGVEDSWVKMIRWAVAQKREPLGKTHHPASTILDANIGSVAAAFADRFLLVEGTAGSPPENVAALKISQTVQDVWKKTHHGTCRVTTDKALTADERTEYNLILIGNERTNSVWQHFKTAFDMKLDPESVEIRGRKTTGSGLSVQSVFDHPERAGGRIVVIGAADIITASFGTLDLSIDGWFQSAIWNSSGGQFSGLVSAVTSNRQWVGLKPQPGGLESRQPKD